MAGHKRRPIAAAVFTLFSTPQLAAAAQAPVTLPEVRVQDSQEGMRREATGSATRTETPLRDIPQFINSIPEDVIRSRGVTELRDVLRSVPGISYAAAEGGTQSNQVVFLRGFPLNGDNYIDGLRDLGEYNRDLFATETVEVLKGPSALLFGRGGSGGIVNTISKTAGLLPHKEVAFQFGSFDQKRLTGDLNLKFADNSGFRMVALAEDSGYFRYPQDVEKQGLAPSVRFGIGTGTELMLNYYYLRTKDVTDYGQPTLFTAATGLFGMPNVSPRKYYGFENHDYTEHETNIFTGRIDHRFNDTVSIHNTLRIAKFRRELEATIATLRNTDINGAPVTAGTPQSLLVVTRNHDGGRTRDNDDDTIFNQTDLTWKFKTGTTRHTMITGMEIARERINRLNYILDANPALAGVQTPTAITPFLAPDPSTVLSYTKASNQRALGEGDTLAFYAQDQIEFSDQWKALVGVRWERFEADTRVITDATGVPTATGGPFSRTDNMISGRGAVIWQPTQRQSYYVSVANSYNPSGELGVYGGSSTSLSVATLNLDPEENRNYEVGAHWSFTPTLQLRSAIFRTEKKNQRINNSVTELTELTGKRRVQGIEFELAGHLKPNWEILSGVAYQDGEIVSAPQNQGNTPLGVAEWSGSVWTTYKFGNGWEIGGGVIANSGFPLTDANNGSVPSYAVVDATVAYVQKKYEIRFNAYNLGDKIYYIGGYNNSPNRVLPGLPRAASLTLRYYFN
jgi:catecholate siderophore receptor